MDILIACEESQIVTRAFRIKGHNAFSCDIQETSGNHPEWHIQTDISDGGFDEFDRPPNYKPLLYQNWDMIIAFPPCTHLAVSGARWFPEKQKDGRQQQAIDFFMLFTNLPCPKVAIENPISIMSTKYRRPDQIIQPWMFGHGETKKTCLWLKGLPKLKPTNIVNGREQKIWKMPPSSERSKLRSKTFKGIAQAMADQWG